MINPIENDLRARKCSLIDAKSAKNIRNKQVGFKIYDDSNSLTKYAD